MEGPDGHSKGSCHVKGQRAPATACFHDTRPGLQLHLTAYVVQFRDLRFLKRCTGRRIISAGIDELRVEPEPVKISIKIVVSLDITTRAAQGVALNIFHALRDEFDVPALLSGFRHGAIEDFECGDEISLEPDSPLAVRIAELSFRIE